MSEMIQNDDLHPLYRLPSVPAQYYEYVIALLLKPQPFRFCSVRCCAVVSQLQSSGISPLTRQSLMMELHFIFLFTITTVQMNTITSTFNFTITYFNRELFRNTNSSYPSAVNIRHV
jgi:hypothetical protein